MTDGCAGNGASGVPEAAAGLGEALELRVVDALEMEETTRTHPGREIGLAWRQWLPKVTQPTEPLRSRRPVASTKTRCVGAQWLRGRAYPYERPDKPLRMRISCAPESSTRTLGVAADCYRQRAHPGRRYIGDLYRWAACIVGEPSSASVLMLSSDSRTDDCRLKKHVRCNRQLRVP